MTRYFKSPLFLLFLFLFAAQWSGCSDDKVRDAAKEQALEATKKSEPEVGAAKNNIFPVEGSIEMLTEGKEVSKGEEVCIPIRAKGFKEIVSMQYTLQWDPAILKFKSLRNFGLPGLSNQNFGTHITDKGKLTHAWFDINVKGITRPDDKPLYEVCFEAIGAPGSKTTIQFVEDPTIIEIANINSAFLELKQVPVMVKIK
ncbi:MAG: hypothetical protein Kow0027_05460 [Saprospiraceae bacterium]